jgi:hypothetical protein
MEDFDQIKHLVLQQLNRCVVCHREYEISDISSVQRKPGVWTLMVECVQCRSRNYIAAVTNDGNAEDAIFEVRSLTERAMQDASLRTLHPPDDVDSEAPESGEPVSAADVLDMYNFLKEFDGDFERLFRSG